MSVALAYNNKTISNELTRCSSKEYGAGSAPSHRQILLINHETQKALNHLCSYYVLTVQRVSFIANN